MDTELRSAERTAATSGPQEQIAFLNQRLRSGKLEGGGVVAFTCYSSVAKNLGERPGWAAMTGATLIKDRQRLVADFEEGRLKNLALTYSVGCEGIRLKRAKRLVHLSRPRSRQSKSEAIWFQAEARVGPDCEIVHLC